MPGIEFDKGIPLDAAGRILATFRHVFQVAISLLPAIGGGVICLVITIFAANLFSKWLSRYVSRRTGDVLIANFSGKALWTLLFLIGAAMALGIVGLGSVSNKILAGAGITTFVVGFALKDIGENFLSGVILAFSRPYQVGSVIECDGIKGVVRSMSLRQTTVEADNEKIVLIPNASILKMPLTRFSKTDRNMRQEFTILVETTRAREAVELICRTISSFDQVTDDPSHPVKIIVDELEGEKVKLLVIFWYDLDTFTGSRSDTRSAIMLKVFDTLRDAQFNFSG